MSDLRERTLGADTTGRELVPSPWTEDKLYIRGLSGNEYDDLIGSVPAVGLRVMARVLCRVLSDEDGARIFKDSDADKLGEQHVQTISDLFGKCLALSGQTPQAQAEVAESFGEAQRGEAISG